MAETRKTKELNLLEDTPELAKKKALSKEDSSLDHEVYSKQTSDPKKEQNKFMKKWHGSKQFRIGIIVGIVVILGLSLGLGLGLGLKKEASEVKFTKYEIIKDKKNAIDENNSFKKWIEGVNETPENDLQALENAAIIWALDQEVALGLVNPSNASAAKDKAEKKAEKEIDNEKKEHKKKADETWDNYLTSLGFDSEEEYYNSKIAASLLSTSDVVDGLTDIKSTTNNINAKDIEKYQFVSSNPKNIGTHEGEYLAITSNSYLDGSPNITQTLMELYLNIAKPVYFQQESISYTLNSSANPGSNPNKWESMTFADNTQVQAAYVMAWKLSNAATNGFYDLGNSDTPVIAPTQSGIKHFNTLPTDLTSLAYYYAAVGDTTNIKTANNETLEGLGEKANKVIIKHSKAEEDTITDNETWSDTSITENDRIDIADKVFDNLIESNLYQNEGRVLGQTISWDSEDTEQSNNTNINNEYLLTTDAAGFTITRMENPNYKTDDESSYDDLYTVGENMLESDLEKELNGMQKSENQGIVEYGIWDDFELWVNDNAKILALNWALTADDSDFLTNEDYHIELMDKLIKKDKDGNPIIDSESGKLVTTKKGQELLNYFYLELIINQQNLFLDKFIAADNFMTKEKNEDIYLKLNNSTNGIETISTLFNDFTFFEHNIISDSNDNFGLISISDLLIKSEDEGVI